MAVGRLLRAFSTLGAAICALVAIYIAFGPKFVCGGPSGSRYSDTVKLVISTQSAVERYKHDKGVYPHAIDDLIPSHLPKVPVDSWGNRIRYDPASHIVTSLGKDGVAGGSGQAAEISATSAGEQARTSSAYSCS
jgi:hypothetical protein